MNAFLQRHAKSVTGSLSGWDRLRFRGTLRVLASCSGLGRFLSMTGRKLKDFGGYARDVSRQVRGASLAAAESAGRPVEYLNGPSVSKEDRAREIAARDGIQDGLIAVLAPVEPCWSYNIKSDPQTGWLKLVSDYRKCQHLYHYMIHPVFGFMHARLQTWLPFNLHVCVNGREMLARQMDAAGIKYVRADNTFTWVSDPAGAQELLDKQITFDWSGELKKVAAMVHPTLGSVTNGYDIDYYWSLDQSEFATDVMFKDRDCLGRLYPGLIRHGIETFNGRDVMRFLGRSVPHGIQPQFNGQVVSDVRGNDKFYDGVRIKHRVNHNSIKMYDKANTVLRIETTINDVRDLKSPRVINGKKVWRPMRKGVADLPRRADVSAKSNDRYLDAMAAVDTPLPLKTLIDKLDRPVTAGKTRVRGLNLLGQDDGALLSAVGRGEYVINGLRNRDLRQALFDGDAKDPAQRRRQSGQVTRKLRMLRAHGLVAKVPHTHRYQVTEKGRRIIAALAAAREADVAKLSKAA